jgi:hypothetical protein
VLLIVRKEQMAALDAAALRSFRRRMVEHLGALFPDRSAQAGEAGLLAAIDAGIREAASFGITAEGDVARFIDVALELGADFLDRPATSWARTVLEYREASPTTRMNRLYQQLEHQLPGLTHLWQAWRP